MKRMILGVFLLLLSAFLIPAIVVPVTSALSKEESVPVTAETKPLPVQNLLPKSGEITLYQTATGKIETINFEEGSQLEAGTELQVGDDVYTVENKLMKYFAKDLWAKRHLQLVLFGRYYCKAIKPLCSECKLKDICKEKKKNL